MKKFCEALALSMMLVTPLFFASTVTAKKDETEEVKKKKKKTEAHHKAAKPVKSEKKEVKKVTKTDGTKQTTKVTEKKVSHEAKKPHAAAAHESKHVKASHVKQTSSDKVIGTTKEGRELYEGPRGGHYYLTDSGNKEYVK